MFIEICIGCPGDDHHRLCLILNSIRERCYVIANNPDNELLYIVFDEFLQLLEAEIILTSTNLSHIAIISSFIQGDEDLLKKADKLVEIHSKYLSDLTNTYRKIKDAYRFMIIVTAASSHSRLYKSLGYLYVIEAVRMIEYSMANTLKDNSKASLEAAEEKYMDTFGTFCEYESSCFLRLKKAREYYEKSCGFAAEAGILLDNSSLCISRTINDINVAISNDNIRATLIESNANRRRRASSILEILHQRHQ